MVDPNCCCCSGLIGGFGLDCDSCDRRFHFGCGTGLSNVGERTITTYLSECVFRCPLCVIGERNNLIPTVININQLFNTNKLQELQKELSAAKEPVDDSAKEPVGDDIVENVKTDGESEIKEPPPKELPANVTPPKERVPEKPRNSDGFTQKVSRSELTRIKRCKGVLYGLNVYTTADTVLILDSNGRGIRGDQIDQNNRVVVKAIGGLCVSATTTALKECKARYPNIRKVAYGLGTNDRLHAHQHPGNKETYLKELDTATKVVFPNASIHFILPFSAISGLCKKFVDDLSDAINSSGVGWKRHRPPSMQDKLMPPNRIHLTPSGKEGHIEWLKKIFAPRTLTQPPTSRSDDVILSRHITNPPAQHSPVKRDQEISYLDALTGDRRITGDHRSFPPLCAKDIAAEVYSMMFPSWSRDPSPPADRFKPPPWARNY